MYQYRIKDARHLKLFEINSKKLLKSKQILLKKTYKELLLCEIETNTHSYNKNKLIPEKGNKNYTDAV